MTVYYVDSIAGLDINSGLTEQLPWKTLAKVITALGLGSGGANVSHTILLKRGSTFNERMTLYFGGISLTQPLIIDAYGTGAKPVINFAAGGQVRGISVASTCTGFFDFRNFAITGNGPGVEYGILYQRTLATDNIYTTLTNVDVYDIFDTNVPASDRNGIMIRGNNFTMDSCVVHDIATDGVWLASDTFTIKNCHIYNCALDGRLAGDCLQVTGTVNGFTIEDNILDHTNSSIKHPLVISGASAGSGGIVRRNQLLMKPSTTAEACYALYCDQPNAKIYNNYLSGGTTSLSYNVANILGAGTSFYGNVVLCNVAGGNGLIIDANNITAYNNTVVNTVASSGTGFGLGQANTGKTGLIVKNNIVKGFARGLEKHTGSSWVESNNVVSNCALPYSDQSGNGLTLDASDSTTSITLDASYTPTGYAVGNGVKWWSGARPSVYNIEPLPDTAIDIGAVQSTGNASHPKNLVNSANPTATAMDLISYTPAELETQLDKVTELDSRVDLLEATGTATTLQLSLSKYILPSIFSGDKEATATAASELMADNLLKIVVKNLSLTTDAYVGIGTSQTLAEANASSGTPWVTRFFIPRNTDAVIFMDASNAYAWKTTSGSAILNITQCR